MGAPLSVLIVEDEPLIAMMLEDFVDVLGGEPSCAVADALSDRGVAFLLATGGHVDPPPARHADAPLLPKPFTMDNVRVALEANVPIG